MVVGTWVDGVPDNVIEQMIVCDANGVDLYDLNAVKRYIAKHRLIKLYGFLSRSQSRYKDAVKLFYDEMLPTWNDEHEMKQSIKRHIKPVSV